MDSVVLVSVIIPTYKDCDTLDRAISSVLEQQNFDNYEVIVVDDNQPESDWRKNTEAFMEKYAANKKVHYIKHSQNKNGAAARNTGVKHAKGDLICFLDDDDIFLPDKLYKQVNYMNLHPEYEASYTWRKGKEGNVVKYSKTGDLSKEILLMEFAPTTITLMVRKKCYDEMGGFDEAFFRHQDYEFLLRFFQNYKIGVVEEPLSQILGKKVGSNTPHGEKLEKLKKQFLTTFDDYIRTIDKDIPKFRKKTYAKHYSDVFYDHLRRGNLWLAVKNFSCNSILYNTEYWKYDFEIINRRIRNKMKNKG